MNRFWAVVVLLGLTVVNLPAQSEEGFYCRSINIDKVYPTSDGYIVVYLKNNLDYHTMYIPMEWVSEESGSLGEVRYGRGSAYPFISIFWSEGSFSYIRLSLHEDRRHSSWGSMNPYVDYSEKFNISELQVEF